MERDKRNIYIGALFSYLRLDNQNIKIHNKFKERWE